MLSSVHGRFNNRTIIRAWEIQVDNSWDLFDHLTVCVFANFKQNKIEYVFAADKSNDHQQHEVVSGGVINPHALADSWPLDWGVFIMLRWIMNLPVSYVVMHLHAAMLLFISYSISNEYTIHLKQT